MCDIQTMTVIDPQRYTVDGFFHSSGSATRIARSSDNDVVDWIRYVAADCGKPNRYRTREQLHLHTLHTIFRITQLELFIRG
jgi:hypothetical protein